MVEVEVSNFQSIEHARVVIQGYTAVVGRSNIGKSAFVRAVKAALTGASGTSFVRHGPNCARRLKDAKKCQCKATVHIKREGFDLLWEKGDAENRYTFNGTGYDAVGSGTPDFLLKAGFGMIKIGDGRELLQVADQFDPIFLLNRTGGVVADVLSDVAHLDQVNGAMRHVEKDRKDAVATRRVREQDVVNLTQRFVGFDGLDGALLQSRKVEERLATIETKDKRVKEISRFMEEGTARALEIKRLLTVDAITVPDLAPCQTSATKVVQYAGWHTKLVAFKAWFERVKGLDNLPSFSCTLSSEGLRTSQDLAARYEILTREVDRLEKAQAKDSQEEKDIRAEWDALGLCPTCEQPCGKSHG